MKTDFKKKVVEVAESFEEVESIVCIISDGYDSAALVGSKDDDVLKSMLISMMLKQPKLKSLFQGAIVAASMIDDDEETQFARLIDTY